MFTVAIPMHYVFHSHRVTWISLHRTEILMSPESTFTGPGAVTVMDTHTNELITFQHLYYVIFEHVTERDQTDIILVTNMKLSDLLDPL